MLLMRALPLLAGIALGASLPSPALAHEESAGGAFALPHDGLADSLAFRSVPRAMATAPEPPPAATPRASCNPDSRPEPGIQGRVAKEEVDSGRTDDGYWCNLARIGHIGRTGGFRVHRYVDRAGRECAYYDTALLFPTNALNFGLDPTGVEVLDMSNPRDPVRTATLATPAMQTPHESLNISAQRGLLAAVLGNPARAPGGVDLYDIREDCRYPEPTAAAFPATPFGHESGIAPDGLTFYPSSADEFSAVDISDPRRPRNLWRSERFSTHGMSVSGDGRTGYLATIGTGLVIVDLSEIQDRKPNPQVQEIGRLTWSNMTIPQIPIPVTIKGRRYVVEVDEFSTDENGEFTAHGDRVGAARIIDVSDPRKPFVVSNLRLDVHQKEHRPHIEGDHGAQSPVQGYAAHYCNVPRRAEPGIVACSMILSGLRVFDIRDPRKPREVAYHVAPPSTISETGGSTIDERANWAMSQPAFAPERREVWYSDGTSGFYTLRLDEDVWPSAGQPPKLRLTRTCGRGGRLRVALTGNVAAVRDVNFKFDKRLVARDVTSRFRRVISRRALSRTKARRLRAVAYLHDGPPPRVILSRSLPRCGS